jgi:hypothetical protein
MDRLSLRVAQRFGAEDFKRFLRKLLGDAEKDLKAYLSELGVTTGPVVRFETPVPKGGYGPYEVGELFWNTFGHEPLASGFSVRVVVDLPKKEVSIGARSGSHVLESLWSRGTTRDARTRLKKVLDFFKESIAREAAEKSKPKEDPVSEEGAWSVVTLGKDHGYATEVDVFKSKADAERAARDLGECYVVKGTQMWNEPLGQVEEHDRMAPSKYFK